MTTIYNENQILKKINHVHVYRNDLTNFKLNIDPVWCGHIDSTYIYRINLNKYILNNGNISNWIASPIIINSNNKILKFNETIISKSSALRLFCDVKVYF
uniref:Uncharacterized protein n=1 Tax=Pithovirus LCPAC102 TaxID=2506587 RepID=A0A481Z2S9_9VIRU|nr:MAG: hypothetical protein LCPAC102_00170 [Pithovirus LCPAC102]